MDCFYKNRLDDLGVFNLIGKKDWEGTCYCVAGEWKNNKGKVFWEYDKTG